MGVLNAQGVISETEIKGTAIKLMVVTTQPCRQSLRMGKFAKRLSIINLWMWSKRASAAI